MAEFDLTLDDIESALRSGSGFENGKLRIYALYTHNPTPKEAAGFLKDEYGIGGRSWTYLDGSAGFLGFNASGMTFSQRNRSLQTHFTWGCIWQYIHGLIDKGAYLSVKDEKALNEVIENWGCLPMPVACAAYPPPVRILTPEEFYAMIPESA